MLELLTAGDFSAQVGTDFRAESLVLTLDEVSTPGWNAAPGLPHPSARNFSLVFSGPGPTVLPQATHALHHASLGTLHIFLVPMGPGPQGRFCYQAIFNRTPPQP